MFVVLMISRKPGRGPTRSGRASARPGGHGMRHHVGKVLVLLPRLIHTQTEGFCSMHHFKTSASYKFICALMGYADNTDAVATQYHDACCGTESGTRRRSYLRGTSELLEPRFPLTNTTSTAA